MVIEPAEEGAVSAERCTER